MGIVPRLRRRRLWLALVSLTFCLPWLAAVGSGRCPLRAGAMAAAATAIVKTPPADDCCAAHCPQTGKAKAPVPVSPPVRAAFCCEVFKACLPLDVGFSKFEWLASPDEAAQADFSIPALADTGFPGVLRDPGLPRPTPPGAFLRTVARRCFPSHAPPSPCLALLS